MLCTLSCRVKGTLLRQTYSPHKSINTSQKRSKIGVTTHLMWRDLSFTVQLLQCAVCPYGFWFQSEVWKYVYEESHSTIVNPCTAGNPLFGQRLRSSECILDTIVINCNNNKANIIHFENIFIQHTRVHHDELMKIKIFYSQFCMKSTLINGECHDKLH